jgi:hypothetical protein
VLQCALMASLMVGRRGAQGKTASGCACLRCKGGGRLAGGRGEPTGGPRVAVREKEEMGEGARPVEVNGPEEERGWAGGEASWAVGSLG